MKTKLTQYLDTSTMLPVYGIQCYIDYKWCNVAESNKPCIYNSKEEAEAKRKQLRSIK